MKKKMLVAGVALAFAGAAWAGPGNCNLGLHQEISAPVLVEFMPHEDPGFYLVEWEAVESADFYAVFCEVLQTYEVDSSGSRIEIDEPVAEWIRMDRVEAVPDQRRFSAVVELPENEEAIFGVAAGINYQGLSAVAEAQLVLPTTTLTAVKTTSWAQVKTTLAE